MDIQHSLIDYLTGGGYYEIKNVVYKRKDDVTIFLDIYFLVISVKNMEMLKKMRSSADFGENLKVNYDDIALSLNGFGRIVQYIKYDDDKNCVLQAI